MYNVFHYHLVFYSYFSHVSRLYKTEPYCSLYILATAYHFESLVNYHILSFKDINIFKVLTVFHVNC